MTDLPRFESPATWKQARALITFVARAPRFTSGAELHSLRVHVRDHKGRDLPAADRILEASYGIFGFTQCRKAAGAARHAALGVSYGRDPRPIRIRGCEGRAYELGPEPEPDDIDGRSPSVIAWSDGEMFFFLASAELAASELQRIAESVA